MTIHIDPINGSDSALGDRDSPLRSFDEYNRREYDRRFHNGETLQQAEQHVVDQVQQADEPRHTITSVEYKGLRHYKKGVIDTFTVKVILPSGEEETWQLFSSAKGQR
jgi:hypothetical protein